jgi:hypothetical protein
MEQRRVQGQGRHSGRFPVVDREVAGSELTGAVGALPAERFLYREPTWFTMKNKQENEQCLKPISSNE